MTSCEVLPPRISALIVQLRELVGGLTIRDRVPQIEVAVGAEVVVLVVRNLASLAAADEAAFRAFADLHGVQFWLQPAGPASAQPFHPLDAPPLYYALPEYGLRLYFAPTEFTQVNPAVNAILVRRALGLLAPRPGERILDLFCGLGNFALPIAACGAEGSASRAMPAWWSGRAATRRRTASLPSSRWPTSSSPLRAPRCRAATPC
jgi:23S rRNA (uracil1939-C5)-methyltransferase